MASRDTAFVFVVHQERSKLEEQSIAKAKRKSKKVKRERERETAKNKTPEDNLLVVWYFWRLAVSYGPVSVPVLPNTPGVK